MKDIFDTGGEFPTLAAAPTTDDIASAMAKGKWRGTEAVRGALKVLFEARHIEQFNFGPLTLETIREAQREALEFIEFGCFELPYPECVLRCSIQFDNRVVGFHLFAVKRETTNHIAALGTIHSPDFTLTFRSDNLLKIIQMPTLGKAIEITVPKREIAYWEPMIGPVTSKPVLGGELIDGNSEIMTESSLLTMGLVMILNTKGVLKERSAPPAKPNKTRAAQGRPLLPYVTKVYTAVYNRAIQPGTGTHASPRPHRRRAHVRRYPATETRAAYVLPIAAMLVNWDGKPLEERKEYVAK